MGTLVGQDNSGVDRGNERKYFMGTVSTEKVLPCELKEREGAPQIHTPLLMPDRLFAAFSPYEVPSINKYYVGR